MVMIQRERSVGELDQGKLKVSERYKWFSAGAKGFFFFRLEVSIWVRLSWKGRFMLKIFSCVPRVRLSW